MKKIVITLLFILYIFSQYVLSVTVLAQETSSSNSIITAVGSPNPSTRPGGSPTALTKAALDLIDSYRQCSSGDTHDVNNIKSCLLNKLSSKGYDQQALDAFSTRYGNAITSQNCVECIGFVALSVTLVSKSGGVLLSGVNRASDVYYWNEINAGSLKFKARASVQDVQKGDIVVLTAGGAGHIFIANDILTKNAGTVLITGLESNWVVPPGCTATPDRKHNLLDPGAGNVRVFGLQ